MIIGGSPQNLLTCKRNSSDDARTGFHFTFPCAKQVEAQLIEQRRKFPFKKINSSRIMDLENNNELDPDDDLV
jgi:hypothetical protein